MIRGPAEQHTVTEAEPNKYCPLIKKQRKHPEAKQLSQQTVLQNWTSKKKKNRISTQFIHWTKNSPKEDPRSRCKAEDYTTSRRCPHRKLRWPWMCWRFYEHDIKGTTSARNWPERTALWKILSRGRKDESQTGRKTFAEAPSSGKGLRYKIYKGAFQPQCKHEQTG